MSAGGIPSDAGLGRAPQNVVGVGSRCWRENAPFYKRIAVGKVCSVKRRARRCDGRVVGFASGSQAKTQP